MDDNRFNSLQHLYNSIDMGLDIVFILYRVKYNISWRENKPFICICPDGDAKFFRDTQDLLDNYKIKGKPLKELWSDIEIEFM